MQERMSELVLFVWLWCHAVGCYVIMLGDVGVLCGEFVAWSLGFFWKSHCFHIALCFSFS